MTYIKCENMKNNYKLKKIVQFYLSENEKNEALQFLNLYYLGDIHCNHFEYGEIVSKYPEKETEEYKRAVWNVSSCNQIEVEIEIDINGSVKIRPY